MRFDFCIGNPPYQESDAGKSTGATPVYDKFVDEGLSICRNSLVMITPSRWMKTGRGLDSFRKDMISNTSLKTLVDYEKADEFFSGVHIAGGICYFLIDKSYNGPCHFKHISADGYIDESDRYLQNHFSDSVIRDSRQISILEKTFSDSRFSSLVSSLNPYGFRTYLFNSPEQYPSVKISDVKTSECSIAVYGVKGFKGGARRVKFYVRPSDILNKSVGYVDYKLFFSKAYLATSTVPPEIIKGYPFEICTETFLKIGNFDTESEMLNALSYLKTKFARALLFFNRSALSVSKELFTFIPLQDFTDKSDIDWSKSLHEIDLQLYKKYGLNAEEIKFIEDRIKPME